MDIGKIKLIKEYHTILSFIIFFSVLFYCVTKINLEISMLPLSIFGTNSETNSIWVLTLIYTSIALWLNPALNAIENNLKYKKTTIVIFTISGISLILLGLLNMKDNNFLHNLFAFIFFISYIIGIFISGFQMIKSDFRMAMISISISILMLLCVCWLMVDIQSIPEILFIILSFIWNFSIIYSNRVKTFIKKFGF